GRSTRAPRGEKREDCKGQHRRDELGPPARAEAHAEGRTGGERPRQRADRRSTGSEANQVEHARVGRNPPNGQGTAGAEELDAPWKEQQERGGDHDGAGPRRAARLTTDRKRGERDGGCGARDEGKGPR